MMQPGEQEWSVLSLWVPEAGEAVVLPEVGEGREVEVGGVVGWRALRQAGAEVVETTIDLDLKWEINDRETLQ